MNRFTPWLVAASMLVIAASLSAVLHVSADMRLVEAVWIGIGVFLLMIVVRLFTIRAGEASGLTARLDDIGGATGKLTREIENLSLRIADLEVALARRMEDTLHDRLSPVVEEMNRVSDQMNLIVTGAQLPAGGVAAPPGEAAQADPAGAAGAPAAPAARGAGAAPSAPARSPAFAGLGDEEMRRIVREAVEAGRIEVHLQPVVTLPQRKVRYYEALARLRSEAGDLMHTQDYLAFAREMNLMPAIDFTVLVRSVQVVRRLTSKNREVGLFLNVSLSTLQDDRFSARYLEFAEHNKALAGTLVFEFTQREFELIGPVEQVAMEHLAELGFRFSVDSVERLSVDGRDMAERRVRFVKADAALLLQANGGMSSDIHPADLSDLLARSGIDLIACRIERESEVVDLIDYDVRFAQGNLFSPPRPVRADVLQDRAPPLEAAQ